MKLKHMYAAVVLLLISSDAISQSAGTPGYAFKSIDVGGSIFISGKGINDNGVVVGVYTGVTGDNHAFLGDIATNIDPPFPGTFPIHSQALGINNAGLIVGEFDFFPNTFGDGFVRDANGTYTTVDFLGAPESKAAAINNNNQVMLTAPIGNSVSVCSLPVSSGCFTQIPFPITGKIFNVIAFGFNSSGTIVGQFVDSPPLPFNVHGFVGGSGYDVPGAVCAGELFTQVTAINDNGDFVGNYLDPNCNGHGFFQSKNGAFLTIDPPGATYTEAWGVNNRGQITGWYDDANGQTHAYIATPQTSCTLDVSPRWTQAERPWGPQNYDHSYVTAKFAAGARVSATGKMELLVGTTSHVINLSANNTILGLRNAINGLHAGVEAVIHPAPPKSGPYYLSLYNTACYTSDCSPRGSHTLQLCDGACSRSPNRLRARTMGGFGCALTSLAMALKFAKVQSVQATVPADLTPESLNDFMSNNSPGLPSPGGLFIEGDVQFPQTTSLMASNNRSSGMSKPLHFDWRGGIGGIDSSKNLPAAEAVLDTSLCKDRLPVIVAVRSPTTGIYPGHFVLLTGKETNPNGSPRYLIADPAGFGVDFNTAYTDVSGHPEFQTRGVVRDPAGDLSALIIATGSIADLLVTDVNSNSTGFDPVTNGVRQEIPDSAYFQDEIEDDDIGDTATGVTHSVNIATPPRQSYRVVVNGLSAGIYTLAISLLAPDGSLQTNAQIQGLSAEGSATAFQITASSAQAGISLSREVSFQTTLDDIENGKHIELIREETAESLVRMIRRAEAEFKEGENRVARRFVREFADRVEDASSKQISSLARQILREDAGGLLRQIPNYEHDANLERR